MKNPDESGQDIVVEGVLDVPLREVSGLTLLTTEGRQRLVAVGDHTPQLALADVASDGSLGDWSMVDPRGFDGPAEHAPDAQLEAVAADSAGLLLLLAEEPSRIHVVDLDARRVVTSFRLDVSGLAGLAEAWDADPSSRGEGLLLLSGGHLLVAKEKHPPGLVEFGPAGDQPYGVTSDSLLGGAEFLLPSDGRLDALGWWPMPEGGGPDDLSEITVDADGGVYLLSDQSASVSRLRLPLRPGETLVVESFFEIPKKAKKIGKTEGLAVLGDGRLFIAGDRPEAGRALVLLSVPEAQPS